MACLEAPISDHKAAAMNSPRISFSNDFADTHLHNQDNNNSSKAAGAGAAVSSDFEFSVSGFSLQLTADQLFSKGRILPIKEDGQFQLKKTTGAATTLRDELLAGDEDDGDDAVFSLRPPLNGRWKSFLGLRKPHKAADPSHIDGAAFSFDSPNLTKIPQGFFAEDGKPSSANKEVKV